MKYPFEFKELHLTESLVRYLGFNNWWGGSGDDMEVAFGADGDISAPVSYKIGWFEFEAMPYTYEAPECQHEHFFSRYKPRPLYFLHDLIDDIRENAAPEDCAYLMNHFLSLPSIKPYIESYNQYKKENGK